MILDNKKGNPFLNLAALKQNETGVNKQEIGIAFFNLFITLINIALNLGKYTFITKNLGGNYVIWYFNCMFLS
ncbi:hypothetical protein TCEA9_22940 [Thermobrachium celere]|nr:hypothetical protein TCEA9_22940 [Thermobrachium celere]